MTSVTRLWLAFAALGAGMIHLAVGASAPLLLAIIMVGFGMAEIAWGITTLVTGRLVVARAALGASLIPVLVWAATATVGSGLGVPVEAIGLPIFSMAIASLFGLFLAAALAVIARRDRFATDAAVTDPRAASVSGLVTGPASSTSTATATATVTATATASPPAQGWRFLTALIVGGLLFSGLTTPALAATEAGQSAVPHGSHSVPGVDTNESGHDGH